MESAALPYQHLKLVKRGHRGPEVPRACGFSFEFSPAWIWALRLSDWSTIYLTDTVELNLRQYHASTWSVVKDRLTIVSIHQISSLIGSVDVWFVSGSREFLESFQGPIATPVAMWAEKCGRRRPSDSNTRTWFSVAHETVGGSTTARGVFGREMLDDLVIPTDPLRRGISHVMKFSIRPDSCGMPCVEDHYVITDRLSVHQVDRPVVYATGFSRSGWGKRQLTDVELSQAFDLPSYVPWEVSFPSDLIPIQIFRVVVDAVLVSIRPTGQDRNTRPRTSVFPKPEMAAPLPIDAEWLATLKQWLSGSWANVNIAGRAAKADNAAIDHFPWNQRIMLVLPAATGRVIAGLEILGLKWWQRHLIQSFLAYLRTTYGKRWRGDLALHHREGGPPGAKRERSEPNRGGAHYWGGGGGGDQSAEKLQQLAQDVKCGFRILEQVLVSSWWEWTGGSGLFFWRWNGMEQIRAARDGIKIFVVSALPKQRKQMPPKLSGDQGFLVAAKLDVMVQRDYLESGYVSNTVHFFAVPKGDTDIRVVFDGTSSGLNETLWSPNFFLPSAKSAAMCMSFSTWMADMDFGDMFHNFHMDPLIRPCSGVELGSLSSLMTHVQSSKPVILRWTRLFMGMRPSPYNAVRHYYWGEEFARGDPSRASNPMGYDRVRLNLPGMISYDPSSPKVMTWRNGTKGGDSGNVAGDVVTFVDDVRILGYSKANCWKVYRQFASRIQYLGMQNAPRKFRPPSQTNAGAWTGTIFKIGAEHITKSVSQEKWEKGRNIVERLLIVISGVKNGSPLLDRRTLEKETGFLNHLAVHDVRDDGAVSKRILSYDEFVERWPQ